MKSFRRVLWIAVGLAFVLFIVLNLPKKQAGSPIIQPVAGFNKGTHFSLTDHHGNNFNSKEMIDEGHYGLIFFGFTHCPVICPTELQKVAIIMDDLPSTIVDKINPLFITIDPERDTVDTLKNYIPLFHPSIIGLTGSIMNVRKTLDHWKVFYKKVNDPDLTEYTMDHSTYIYLVDHTMTIKALFRTTNTPEDISHHIQTLIE